MADNIRATPQNATLGAIAAALRRAQQFAGQYQVDPRIPLLGGTGVDELLSLPGAASLMEDVSYNGPRALIRGGNVATGGIGTFRLDPRVADVADVALNVSPLAAVAGKAAARGATTVGRAGERIAERVVPSIMERGGVGAQALQALSGGTRSQVVKPKGGNWLAGSIERAIEPMKPPSTTAEQLVEDVGLPMERAQEIAALYAPETAINKWLDTKLTKYIRNEMGTPEDPVRALAERGILHVDPERGLYASLSAAERNRAAADAMVRTPKLDSPGALLGDSPAAQAWEDATDAVISPHSAGVRAASANEAPARQGMEPHPWLGKLDPETPVYHLQDNGYGGVRGQLGFDHLIDELKFSMDPNSGLPRQLRFDPKDIDKLTVPQAVERVSKINAWRAAQKAEADMARAMGPATQVVKEYPEQGFKWVELRAQDGDKFEESIKHLEPEEWQKAVEEFREGRYKALEDALKYEGETMGHCVGGYCPDVVEGRSRIYSLRDKKGQPHVTIEVAPQRSYGTDHLEKFRSQAQDDALVSGLNPGTVDNPRADFLSFVNKRMSELADQNLPMDIVQIKGKANRAPKEEYLPAVQDFIRSGNFGKVGDLGNTGLVDVSKYDDRLKQAAQEAYGSSRFLTNQEMDDLMKSQRDAGYSNGGAVRGFQAGGLVKGAVKGIGELVEKYLAKEAPKEQKMLMGVYRGYAGEDPGELVYHAGAEFKEPRPGLFTNPDRAAVEQFQRFTGAPRLHKLEAKPRRTGTEEDVYAMARRLGIYNPGVPAGQYLEQGENAIFPQAAMMVEELRNQGLDSLRLADGISKKPSLVALDPAVVRPAPELFATPQRRVAEYYANKRSAQTGERPHLEMLLVDPFAGRQYGHSTMGSGKQEPMTTRARKLKSEQVQDRTKLYAEGGAVSAPTGSAYDPNEIDTIVSQLKEEFHA